MLSGRCYYFAIFSLFSPLVFEKAIPYITVREEGLEWNLTRNTELWKCKTIIGADRNVDLQYNISDRKAFCL